MSLEILYWHWIVLGVGLILLEIALPTFMMLWFGIGALLTGLVLLIFPSLSITIQLLLWTLSSAAITIAWFQFLKPLSVDKTKAGLAREAIIGQTGMVIQAPAASQRGKLRLSAPILGNDEWIFIAADADSIITVGDRVRVTDISGNSLIIQKQ